MRSAEKQAAPPALVRALLDGAGIAGEPTVVAVPSPGRVNTTTIIAVGGERFAVRAYGWPFGGEPPFDRRAKEATLHPRLAAVGVPVPEVLTVASVDGVDGALLTYAPGELLGVVAQQVAPPALDEAWREAGAALARAHAVDVGPTAGFLTADGVLPFTSGLLSEEVPPYPPGSWGGFLASDVRHRGRLVADHVGLAASRFAAVADALVAPLDARPVRLGHSDANAWNVLVAEGDDGWHLSSWLDWEFAWAADPSYDLVRATVQRYAPIGPTPEAFWSGYGSAPDALGLAAAALHYLLGTHAEEVRGIRSPELDMTLAHGPRLVDLLSRVEDLLAGGP